MYLSHRGWSGDAMVLGKLSVRGVLLIWIRVGQRPTALAVGADGGCLDTFSRVSHSLSFSLSLGDGPIQTEIQPLRAVKPKTRNQKTLVTLKFNMESKPIISSPLTFLSVISKIIKERQEKTLKQAPRLKKIFFILNSTEYEIFLAHKC